LKSKFSQVRITLVSYLPPVVSLLTYGNCHSYQDWPDYVTELGLGAEQIPELIRMATDRELNCANSNCAEVWAPVHAWRTLGQLRAETAIEPLLTLFDRLDDGDWIGSEMPQVYQLIGPVSIPTLSNYLADPSHQIFSRITAIDCLGQIGIQYPQVRSECINIIMRQLEFYAENQPLLNTCLVNALNELKATSSLKLQVVSRQKRYLNNITR